MGKKKTRVLIVDDHPAMRHALGLLIGREEDMEVFAEAGSRDECMKALTQGTPDMAIVDISLNNEGPSGIDLISEIRSSTGDVPVLVLSGHDEQLYAERVIKAGASGYLSKQAPVKEIVPAVRAVLGGERYFSAKRGSVPHAASADPMVLLSQREFEVFRLLGHGLPARKIAEALKISTKTVETHKFNIRRKLNLSSVEQTVRFAVRWIREHSIL